VIAAGPIGRDPAQRLARTELSRAIYHQHSIPAAVEHFVLSLLQRFFGAASHVTPGGWWTVVALVTLAAAACAAVAVRLGPLARSARGAGPARDPFSRGLTARQLRDAAAASDAAADYSTAILQRLRAIVASCEERGVLAPDAGRTADELATQAGTRFPAQRASLAAAARLFDQIRYGDRTGTLDGYKRLCDLDAMLTALRPEPLPGQAPSAAGAAGARAAGAGATA
jgi:Domain of unknown function (DUF4129)